MAVRRHGAHEPGISRAVVAATAVVVALAFGAAACAFDRSALRGAYEPGDAGADHSSPHADSSPQGDAPPGDSAPQPDVLPPGDAAPADAAPADAAQADAAHADAAQSDAAQSDAAQSDAAQSDAAPQSDAGVCNGVIALPVSAEGITISTVTINGGPNVATMAAGSSFTLAFSYTIKDCVCTGCRDQIEIGFVPGAGVSYCAYDAVPGCTTRSGVNTHQLTAPSSSGAYDIRFNQRQDYGCGLGWWDSTPPASQTIARICVR